MEKLMDNEALWHLCEEIFRYLDLKTLLKCRMVSKLWNELLERLALVKYLDKSRDKVAEFHREIKKYTEEEILTVISGWNKAVQKYDKQASIEDLRKLKCSLGDFDNSWRTHPVRDAIKLGLANDMEFLFSISYDIEINDGKISLQWTNWGNHYEMAKWILESAEKNGAIDLNARDFIGRTPFHVACSRSNTEIVKLILEYSKDKGGIDLNARDNLGQQTAFHLTCSRMSWSREETVKLILDFSYENDTIDLDAKNDKGRTPFQVACEDGKEEIIKLIFEYSKDKGGFAFNARDDRGLTAFHLACEGDSTETLKLILEYSKDKGGIDLNARDDRGLTAFQLACRSRQVENVKLILNFSKENDAIDLNARDDSGMTALHSAITCGAIDIVKLILDFSLQHDGVNLNARDDNGFTPFYLACFIGKIEAIKLMLDFSQDSDKIDLNASNDSIGQWTAFHNACSFGGNPEMAKLILNFAKANGRIDLNAKDEVGNTAFQLACIQTVKETAEFILQNWKEFGIDIKAQNNEGCTTLDMLMFSHDKELITMLKEEYSKIDDYEPPLKMRKI